VSKADLDAVRANAEFKEKLVGFRELIVSAEAALYNA